MKKLLFTLAILSGGVLSAAFAQDDIENPSR